jgi:hypothetical protein
MRSLKALPLLVMLLTLPTSVVNASVKLPSATNQTLTAKVSNAAASLPTSAQVIQAVAAATSLKSAPSDLSPPANAVSQYGGLPSSEQPCDAQYAVTTPPTCQIGDASGKMSIVLWGDSHAAMWMPAVQAIASHIKARLYVYAKAGCAPNTFEPIQPNTTVPYTTCVTYRQNVLKNIAKVHPSLVLITGAFKGVEAYVHGATVDLGTWNQVGWSPTAAGEAIWDSGLKSTLATLKPLAGRVAVIGDDAYPLQDQAQCLSEHARDLKDCTAPRSQAIYATHNADEAAIAKTAGDNYVSVTQWMCTATVCPPVISTYAVYLDSYHITSEYSVWLSEALGVGLGLLPAPRS